MLEVPQVAQDMTGPLGHADRITGSDARLSASQQQCRAEPFSQPISLFNAIAKVIINFDPKAPRETLVLVRPSNGAQFQDSGGRIRSAFWGRTKIDKTTSAARAAEAE